MKLERINHLLSAGFSCFYLLSDEVNRAQSVLINRLKEDKTNYQFAVWDCTESNNPMDAINNLNGAEENTIMIAKNFHWFFENPMIVQTILNNVEIWESQRKAFVVITSIKKLPKELEKFFTFLELDLPEAKEIEDAVNYICPSDDNGKLIKKFIPKNMQAVINSAKGLTAKEIENVFSLSLVEKKCFDVSTINEYKEQIINKSGFVEVVKPKKTFKDVIGLEVIKEQISGTVNNPKAKGVLMIGPPGTGKTALMEAVAGETKKLTLKVNMGKFFSKFQGETDKNVFEFINLVKSIGDCILFLDEFEKQFAGTKSDGSLDSGVTKRSLSQWLDFMQNRPQGVYMIGTANSVDGIPGEYLRIGRWDCAPFFVDLPNDKIKVSILKYYIDKFELKDKAQLSMPEWTGAEIEGCCQIADMREITIKQAAKFVIPQAMTMERELKELRTWAENRTISASSNAALKLVKGGSKNKKRKIDVN